MKKLLPVLLIISSSNSYAQNVGIGTTTPSAPLHIKSGLTEVLRIEGANPYISLFNGTSYKGYLWHNTNRLELGTSTAEPVIIAPNAAASTYFTASGTVGIGVSNPAAKLDVSSSGPTPAKFNGSTGMYIPLHEGGVYRGYLGSYAGNNEDVDFGTGISTTGKLHLTIEGVPKLTIDNVGTVGVGTTNPDADSKLHVTSTGLKGGYFTSSSVAPTSSIITTQATGSIATISTGITVQQGIVPGKGRGLNVFAGNTGGEFNSVGDAASHNYGIISRTISNNDAWAVFASTQGGVGLGGTQYGVYSTPTGGSTRWAFWGNGNAYLSGGTWQTSDERLKRNITSLVNTSTELQKLSAKSYLFDANQLEILNLPNEKQFGFLASEVEKIYPNLVKEVDHFTELPEPGKEQQKVKFKAVNYAGFIPILVEAVNEHSEIISALKEENKQLKDLVEMLMNQNKTIKSLEQEVTKLKAGNR